MSLTLPFLSFSGIKLVPVRSVSAPPLTAPRRARSASSPSRTSRGKLTEISLIQPERSAGNSRAKTAAPAASRYTIRASSGSDEPFEISLKVEGMMCDGCVSSVTEALEAAEDAVKEVKVDLEAKKVSVFVACDTMMDGLAMMPQLVEAVQEAGFEAEPDF